MRLAFTCESRINFYQQVLIVAKTTVIQSLFILECLPLKDDCLAEGQII